MKKYPNIDYSYQPKSYWDEDNVLQTILRDVKGAERRKMIKAYYEDGNFQELDSVFMQSSLTNDERKHLGAIHPMFMGGVLTRLQPRRNRDRPHRVEIRHTGWHQPPCQ